MGAYYIIFPAFALEGNSVAEKFRKVALDLECGPNGIICNIKFKAAQEGTLK